MLDGCIECIKNGKNDCENCLPKKILNCEECDNHYDYYPDEFGTSWGCDADQDPFLLINESKKIKCGDYSV